VSQVERWQRVEQVLDAALTSDPSSWPSVLDEKCSGDPALRAEVEALLAKLPQASSFLATPPGSVAAALIEETVHIVVLNMSAIFAQVRCDAVCARVFAFDSCEDGVRFDGSSRLAKRRDVVDVNVKSLVH
jgi:hypothetical protein